eukprot:6409476-Pyramimonas_sp.AAC.1
MLPGPAGAFVDRSLDFDMTGFSPSFPPSALASASQAQARPMLASHSTLRPGRPCSARFLLWQGSPQRASCRVLGRLLGPWPEPP